jgi:hypothetical protein
MPFSSTRTRRGIRSVVVSGGAVLALALGSLAAPAGAGTVIPSLPRTDADDTIPRVVDDAVVANAGVRELRLLGSTMYAGGQLNSVVHGTTTYTRRNLFSFNASTGAVSSWAPVVDGPVYAMEPTADGRYLYIGGDFRTFDGRTVNRLVKYDLVNQRVDTAFRFPRGFTRVSDLQLVSGRLFVAGNSAGGIVSVDPNTGARTTYLDGVQAAGSESGFSTRVYRFAVDPAGNRMVVIGSFTSIGGQPRQQAAMVNLGTTATVSAWTSARWNEDCYNVLQWYSRDVDWTPDGTGFVIVTSGGGFPGTQKLCDTITRWAPVDAAAQQPVWINYSGGDTFHSVVATDRAIFASGHFRWLDNPQGRDTKGPGAVDRLGIGAVDPVTGRALAWNPTKSIEGGHGAYDLYFTRTGGSTGTGGLWVGHLEKRLGTGPTGIRELHEGLGLLPF